MGGKYPQEEIIARLEVALYSSGRPLSLEELVKASGSNSKDDTLRIVKELVQKTRNTFKALEISELQKESFAFQVKPSYTPLVRRFAQQPIISVASLKTLSYIAYEQPITSKRLVQIRGSQAYSHVKDLKAHSFIESENLGRLKIYRTTRKFQEYFGISDLISLKSSLVEKGA
ncbi:MAG TPA: SMC-Scp complex subunit ScpB [Nitrososphaeraceae archaeon]